MLEFLKQPWAWYVSGPLIALSMAFLLFFGKSFGVSASLRTACAMTGVGKFSNFFHYDWKRDIWNILFVLGAILGGFIASTWLSPEEVKVAISKETVQDLQVLGINAGKGYIPEAIFSWDSLFTLKGFIILVLGGFMIGFGARYAGGCTSGHAISGLSNLQIPSLIAVIGFFIGGLLMTHLLFPLLMNI